jgi:hypothetical protein
MPDVEHALTRDIGPHVDFPGRVRETESPADEDLCETGSRVWSDSGNADIERRRDDRRTAELPQERIFVGTRAAVHRLPAPAAQKRRQSAAVEDRSTDDQADPPLATGRVVDRVDVAGETPIALAGRDRAPRVGHRDLLRDEIGRQAKAALSVCGGPMPSVVSYRDVAFLAAVLGHEDLVDFLVGAYLTPLAGERDGGAALRETLAAFLAAGRQVSSTASALGVARQTVTKRLRLVEERIGRPLDSCGAEIEMALRLVDHDPELARRSAAGQIGI